MRPRVIALITSLALGILLAPPLSHSQPAVKVARVGLLPPLSAEAAAPLIEAFRLRRGQNHCP